MAAMLKILTPDGTKLHYLTSEVPKDNVLESSCKMRIRESTPNSIGDVQTRNLSRSIEAELSDVKEHGNETH